MRSSTGSWYDTSTMSATCQVRRPLYTARGGEEEYAFYALFRNPQQTPSFAQLTNHHSLGGYLFRGIVEPDIETGGEYVSVYLDCGGPDDEEITTPSRVAGFWGLWTRSELTLVHLTKWSELGITEEDLRSDDEQIYRVCSVEVPGRIQKHLRKAEKLKFNVPEVTHYRGHGQRQFVPDAGIQKGLFGDESGKFLFHFRLALHSESSDNEGENEVSTDGELDFAQLQIPKDVVLANAIKARSKVLERIIDYDSKLSTITNEIVLVVVRKEMKVLSKVATEIPELCDYVQ